MPDDPTLVDRTGGGLLVLGGAVTLGTALWLATLSGSDGAWYWALSVAVAHLGETPTLVRGPLVGTVLGVGLAVLAALLVLVAAGQVLVGWRTFEGGRGRRPLVAAVVGALNPLAVPISLFAIAVLLYRRRAVTTAGSERLES